MKTLDISQGMYYLYYMKTTTKATETTQSTNNQIVSLNEDVARGYLYKVANKLNLTPVHIEWVNKDKESPNYFQMDMIVEPNDKGISEIWGRMIHVNDSHKVITRRTNLMFLDKDYEDVKS